MAYGIWGATGAVATAILSAFLFSEPVSVLMGVGIVLVVAGVLTLELGSHQAAPTPGEELLS